MSWPVRIGAVPRLADDFQTRTAVAELAASPAGSADVVVGTTRIVSGLGGVGKTQLAAGHAEQLWGDRQLGLLVWVAATSRDAIVDRYAHTAASLALPGADGANTGRDAERLLAWLATTTRRWLIVLDDLTTIGSLQGLWPPSRAAGRIVITTRLRDPVLAGGGRKLIDLDLFTSREAATYLRSRFAAESLLADDIDGVAQDLGYLPLALRRLALRVKTGRDASQSPIGLSPRLSAGCALSAGPRPVGTQRVPGWS